MSDEEHQFESKADAGASQTYPQQASTIRRSSYVNIKNRPCKVPRVTHTDYQLIDISEDGFASLLTENGNIKDDLKFPNDDTLLSLIKDGFTEGKDLFVTVISAMGEERICGLKEILP